MYEIGQLIVYGNEGVCRVEEIGTPKISGVDKHREYYTLAPIYREGKVFTPVDSKVFMRPVITREEALALIDRIPQMTAQVYENSNLRFLNEHYQQCIQDYTCADLLQLFAGGVLFGTAGLKILTSRDAKKVYTQTTAAVLRAKESVMTTATAIKEGAADILADAKDVNEQRAVEAEAEVIEDAAETVEEKAAE